MITYAPSGDGPVVAPGRSGLLLRGSEAVGPAGSVAPCPTRPRAQAPRRSPPPSRSGSRRERGRERWNSSVIPIAEKKIHARLSPNAWPRFTKGRTSTRAPTKAKTRPMTGQDAMAGVSTRRLTRSQRGICPGIRTRRLARWKGQRQYRRGRERAQRRRCRSDDFGPIDERWSSIRPPSRSVTRIWPTAGSDVSSKGGRRFWKHGAQPPAIIHSGLATALGESGSSRAICSSISRQSSHVYRPLGA